MRILITTLALIGTSAGLVFAADAKAGQAVYDKSCKSCHGADGTPNAAIAKMMKVEMKDLKSAEVQAMSDADIKKVISRRQGQDEAHQDRDRRGRRQRGRLRPQPEKVTERPF